ncbi:hypothetical protein ACFR99_19840 [Haloarchaeobius amylolyticus]|uniref:Lipoprotein n=1 Tax=Haloarchaeobius amylolyticus TaxID=1198296 RepID=A0ABD6BLR8_9EURY
MERRICLSAITSGIAITAGCISNKDGKKTSDDDSDVYGPPPEYGQPTEFDEVKSLQVENNLNETVNMSITVTGGDGAVLSEKNVTAPKDGTAKERIPVADESGNYTVEVTIEGRGTATDNFSFRTPVSGPELHISGGRESFSISVAESPNV